MPSLTLIGAGQVGKVLGYLFCHKIGLKLDFILTNSLVSGQAAYEFIGSGQAASDYSQLKPTDYYLIATPDETIRACAEQLAQNGLLSSNTCVIHCSGALSSAELVAAKAKGAQIASLHPVKSFVDPKLSITTFSETYCAIEGDPAICKTLMQWVQALGGNPFTIAAQQKLIYHSALVIASNYLVALTETALKSLEMVGLERRQAMQILQPLMRHTLEQIFSQGTMQALSGPIARGEVDIVSKELQVLEQQEDTSIAILYKNLGRVALELASSKGSLTTDKIQALNKVLLLPVLC
jgi:predicted short-subunit dehydrogenase-like oxidoreductase (DUF2520 family)